MQSMLVRANAVATGIFAVVIAVGAVFGDDRWAQTMVILFSTGLFGAGIFATLSAYVSALDRSRVHEIGVANLYLLTGKTAPTDVKRTMTGCLVAQCVIALAGAWIGFSGLGTDELNALAFGILVPMFGIGMNGAWAARYGSFGPRLAPRTKTSNRRIE